MITERYRFANLGVEITSTYPQIHMLCKDYVSSCPPEITVAVGPEDIVYEQEKAIQHAKQEGLSEPQYPKTYLEALTVHRKMAESFPAFERMLIHGSALALDGQGYLFTAASGVGKSTHSRLWRELFGHRVVMINDDKPLLHITPTVTRVYGSPWAGKHFLSANISAPLKGVCFLERGQSNEITEITADEAYTLLLKQCYRPKERDAMLRTLELLDTLSRTVGMYRLRCNMDIQAARVACERLTRR